MAAVAKPARRGVVERLTGKVGPLPVWAWALLILVAGYLVYRLTAGGGTTSSPVAAPADTGTATTSGDGGSPPASGQGTAADNLNGDTLTQLAGLQGSIDSLTGLIQSTPAFGAGDGSSGSGSIVPNDGGGDTQPPATFHGRPPETKPPSAAPPAPAKVRYYTFAPGKAPRGRAKDAAPARGPAGTTLRFARGKGYFYA